MKIMARLCLHETDAERAIAALRKRGYEILTHVFPNEPDYVFAEATREFDHQASEHDLSVLVLEEVSEIVDPLFGNVADAGTPPAGHVPFQYETPTWRGTPPN